MVIFCVERRKSWRIIQSRAGIENQDYLDQKELLDAFLRKWFTTSDGVSIAGVYHAFESEDQFTELVEGHLRKLTLRHLEATPNS